MDLLWQRAIKSDELCSPDKEEHCLFSHISAILTERNAKF